MGMSSEQKDLKLSDAATEEEEDDDDEEEEVHRGKGTSDESQEAVESFGNAKGRRGIQEEEEKEEKRIQQSTTVFVFWLYVISFVSVLTLLLVLLTPVFEGQEEAEFFSMPPDVRHHSLKGKLLKLELGTEQKPIKIFVREEGSMGASLESIVFLHGLGSSSFMYRHVFPHLVDRGYRAVAIDFPGAGLSEKPFSYLDWGIISIFRDIFYEISEKGIFWRFEQLFETGAFPEPVISARKNRKDLVSYNAKDLADIIDQVVYLLCDKKPVHIVLHDTSVESGLTWANRNPSIIRSITLMDVYPGIPSFPAFILNLPILGSLVLWSSYLHQAVLNHCCVKGLAMSEASSHVFLLKYNRGIKTMLQTWKSGNSSFDVVSNIESLGEVPIQVLWSNSSGRGWYKLGKSLASRLQNVSYLSHNGGRWPQEETAKEISEDIYRFVASLPEMESHLSEESSHGHGDDGEGHNDHSQGHSQHGDHVHGRFHDHGLGYMDNIGHGGAWIV